MAHNRPPQAGNNPQTSICSIASLRPNENRWQIIAKVTQKSGINPWRKNDREGTWFSFQLVDESGEIRASAYNADVDKYYEMLEVNQKYFVSNGQVKKADEAHRIGDREIILNAYSAVQLFTEDVESAMAHNRPPQAGNNPQTSICSIASLRPNENRWQIIAKVTQKSGINPWRKNDREGTWFSFQLVDESGEIRASAYNADVDKYYEMLEVNQKYFVSNGQVKKADEAHRIGDREIILNAYSAVQLFTEDVEPAMAVVSTFKGFSELARLFDKCEFVQEETRRHTISFREATERLRTAVEKSLSGVEVNTRRVSEFRIGKTSVKSKENQTFDPMKPATWVEVGETITTWRENQQDNYGDIFEVGCVTNELIPKVIMETNTAIRMDHQMYALGMVQALVHHYMVHEPDARLRNTSFDIGNRSEGEIGEEGTIIYVAYKLESGNIQADGSVIKKEEQEGAASPASLDDIASPPNADKDATATQKDEILEASTSDPIQGAIHERTPEEEHVSNEKEKIKKKIKTNKKNKGENKD